VVKLGEPSFEKRVLYVTKGNCCGVVSVCLPRKVICTAQSVCTLIRETAWVQACAISKEKLCYKKRVLAGKGSRIT